MRGVTFIGLLGAARRLGTRPPYRLRGQYTRLLDTALEVQIVAASRAQAEQAEHDALSELERLGRVLGDTDPQSEWRRWQAHPEGTPLPLSLDLTAVLRLADHWRVRSGGALHPGAGVLSDLWRHAAHAGREPPPQEVQRLVSSLQGPPWTLHADGRATLHARAPLALGALARGYMVDRAAAVASRAAGVRRVTIRAGEALRVLGPGPVTVAVADPFTAMDNAPCLARVRVQGGALAMRGAARPGQPVGEPPFRPLVDPRTGCPAPQVPGLTVTAPDGATAEALATVLGVVGVRSGLALVDQTPGCAALVVTPDGQRHRSRAWPRQSPRDDQGW
ncbi:FAD:protein FMN transferase [Deinococcus multiflagellatus]|uniref:FAD:protein FMN transferase n=1 Tax=Deinococcus multiflagellatus TaxID=1656887 RepID=A0ABW1ZRK5_9DEIO|nr:FAD:protein FMN transferase [Deinococcus multiflagellatus]MBZ9712663.1 FAD:protein FMN transferase [Deinococcus multiflagellatus]